MDSVNRWCEKCFSNTPHTALDSDKIMSGKKTNFEYKCEICGRKKRMPKFRGMAESTY